MTGIHKTTAIGIGDPTAASGRIKACASCGEPFRCCAPDACWCGAVKVDPQALKRLASTYTDCLCTACLAREGQRSAPGGRS